MRGCSFFSFVLQKRPAYASVRGKRGNESVSIASHLCNTGVSDTGACGWPLHNILRINPEKPVEAVFLQILSVYIPRSLVVQCSRKQIQLPWAEAKCAMSNKEVCCVDPIASRVLTNCRDLKCRTFFRVALAQESEGLVPIKYVCVHSFCLSSPRPSKALFSGVLMA